jgi:D-alanine transaminase
MPTLANLNGEILPLHEAKVSVLDRAFLFGDGVYEGMHLANGRVRFFDRHFERLRRSLAEIRIHGVDLERLRQRVIDTIVASELADAFIYLQITRGAGPTRTHYFPVTASPTEFLFVEPFKDPYESNRNTGVKVVTFPDLRWGRCDIKSLNLLGNVLAAQAAREQDAAEAVLINRDGYLTEGARTSFFGVVEGKIRTGPLTPAILPGVTRGFVLELIRDMNLPVEERHLHVNELPRVSELMLTGTTAEVLPVIQIDEHPVADGRPGPITQQLQHAFREAVALI